MLRYGNGRLLEFNPPPGAELFDLTPAACQPLGDPAVAVTEALAEPLGYPPLAKATIPGDHVTVVLDRDVPQAELVVAGAVTSLLDSGISPEDITILLTEDVYDGRRDAIVQTLPAMGTSARIVKHDPTDRESLSYLAASKENKAIYVNRYIFDADVVLPIGCLLPSTSLGHYGVHDALFPAFSDEEMQARFRSPETASSAVVKRRRGEEVKEAAWLLGIQIVVQVIPGPGNSVLHVLAGDAGEIARRGGQLCERAWLHKIPRQAGLVVAAIDGPDQQTWENFGRVLAVALQAVDDDGAVVVCTSLKCRPGPALQRLAAPDDELEMIKQIRRTRSADAVAASLLLEVGQRAKVYLLSGLDEETVEDLGIGYVSNAGEIDHLAGQFDSCILLPDAHRAAVTLIDQSP
jgi:nickel-dependent lactate racemase